MRVIPKYLVGVYARSLAWCLGVGGFILFLVEVFEKLSRPRTLEAPPAAVATYLLLKIPKLLLDAYPAATLLALLLGLGLLARNNEVLALRACGVSQWQRLRPLLAAAAGVSVLALAWAEHVVPSASSRSRLIRDTEIAGRDTLSGREGTAIWVRSGAGFVRAEYFDAERSLLLGVSLFQTGPRMQLARVIEAPRAAWTDGRWQLEGATVKEIGEGGRVSVRKLAAGEDVALEEPPLTFEKRQPKANEMTYRALSDFIRELESRGVAATDFRVERALKLAWPFTGVISMLVAAPLAARGGRRYGIGQNVAAGLLVGFCYWLLFAVCVAAGRTGDLPPAVAAWVPNLVFLGLGTLLLYHSER